MRGLAIRRDADRGGAQQPALGVLGRVGSRPALLDVLDGDEALELELLVDDRAASRCGARAGARCASVWLMPSRPVTSLRVITASTCCSRFVSKRTSRLVTMPTSLLALRPRGCRRCRAAASARCARASGACGSTVTDRPPSRSRTSSPSITSSACCSGVMFLWMTPMPPSCAMAMAVRASVTVSIAADSSGMLSRRLRVSRVREVDILRAGPRSRRAGAGRRRRSARAGGRRSAWGLPGAAGSCPR